MPGDLHSALARQEPPNATRSDLVAGAEARIRAAALERFCAVGYQATTVREIARASGLSVPGLYHYYGSKYEILLELMRQVMSDLIAMTKAAVRSTEPGPVAQLRAAVEAHVTFHAERQAESFVGNTELRSLRPRDRRTIIGVRDEQQRIFDSIILDGIDAGVFCTDHAREASRALVTMCTAVASWYHAGGGLPPEELAHHYAALALSLVGAQADQDHDGARPMAAEPAESGD